MRSCKIDQAAFCCLTRGLDPSWKLRNIPIGGKEAEWSNRRRFLLLKQGASLFEQKSIRGGVNGVRTIEPLSSLMEIASPG